MTIRELKENPVKLIAQDWALVSAGTPESWNTMTVSWGGVGELWGKDVAFIFIRPQRHTKKFIDEQDYFTLSFFDESYKDTLTFCGRVSGKDCDKISKAGLHVATDGEAIYPAEARLTLKCRKLAVQMLDNAGFLDASIEKNYAAGDYHYVYVGEIEKIIEKN